MPQHNHPAVTESTIDLAGWRIGYYLALGSSRTAPAVANAVMRSVRLLTELGAEAEEFSPPDPEQAARLFAEVFILDGHDVADDARQQLQKPRCR